VGLECATDEVEELLARQGERNVSEATLNLLPFGTAGTCAIVDVVSEAGVQHAHE
jgi:hypothetical protein